MKTVETRSTSTATENPEPVKPDEAAQSRAAVPASIPPESALMTRLHDLWAGRRSTSIFVLIWLVFNVLVNARYPGEEPAFWYLIPSLDVIVIFMCFLLGALLEVRCPRIVRGGVVGWFFIVRVIRFGDGLQQRYYGQRFNSYTDLPLVPELVRFTYSSLKWWQFSLLSIGVIGLLLGFFIACYRALGYAERYLHDLKNTPFFCVATSTAFILTWLIGHQPENDALFRAGFAASASPRLKYEFDFLRNVYWKQADEAKIIQRTEERLAQTPSDLAKLAGKNVHLILIESYGQTVIDRPLYQDSMRTSFDSFEAVLGASGYSIVSNVLDSPTYGGHSWLALATLDTGISTTNQLNYEVVLAEKPKAIARFFGDAGYRTVLAQPGTTRPWPKGEYLGFEQKYYLWNFDYVGPKYAWATMPDEYVLDFMGRHEVSSAQRPLFLQYVLVSSHAPWSDQPPLVDDWSKVRDGAIYNQLETTHFPIVWPNFANASEAYITSIKYDFEVLKHYLSVNIKDDSLIIILGDHQPVADVNDHSPSHGVPIHVLSRSAALLQPFIARGYTAGMRPHRTGERPGLETFLPNFLADFSNAPARKSR